MSDKREVGWDMDHQVVSAEIIEEILVVGIHTDLDQAWQLHHFHHHLIVTVEDTVRAEVVVQCTIIVNVVELSKSANGKPTSKMQIESKCD